MRARVDAVDLDAASKKLMPVFRFALSFSFRISQDQHRRRCGITLEQHEVAGTMLSTANAVVTWCLYTLACTPLAVLEMVERHSYPHLSFVAGSGDIVKRVVIRMTG